MNPVNKDARLDQLALAFPASGGLDFELPAGLEAGEPPEARGLARDRVRLLVSRYLSDEIDHTRFQRLPEHLRPGDVLAINISGTRKAALPVSRQDGLPLELHLSTRLPADLWIVELRRITPASNEPFLTAAPNERLDLPGGGSAILLIPYDPDLRASSASGGPVRLWVASLELPFPVDEYLDEFGYPIRYRYVKEQWPISYYQNVYTTQVGSAEMPSAGRAFTPELITRLVAMGVQFAPLVLHAGVASLEAHEKPHEEYFQVPVETARTINTARAVGGRIIAVGTTTVRALETVAGEDGRVYPGLGWTRLVVTPERGLKSIDGLLTGFHEPRASHLELLAALAGYPHLRYTYQEALLHGYLWHEFGDLHLILP